MKTTTLNVFISEILDEFLRSFEILQLVIKVEIEYMPPFDETITLKKV